MRGWPVSFINDQEPIEYGDDWIGQEWDRGDYVEAWRFFRSGLFNQLRSVSADWRIGTGPQMETPVPDGFDSVIEAWEILYFITEVFELAARFTTGGPPVESTTVSICLDALSNRALVVGMPGRRSSFFQPYRATIQQFEQERTLTNDGIAGRPVRARRRCRP